MHTSTNKSSEHATRANLEAEFLRRLFARDAHVWRERMTARDSIVASRPVRRQNPQIEKAPREAPSIFEDAFSIGRF
jgi:hypothetical protein